LEPQQEVSSFKNPQKLLIINRKSFGIKGLSLYFCTPKIWDDLVEQLVEHPDFYREGTGFEKLFDKKIIDLVAQLVEHPDFYREGHWVRKVI
jgi:hypothetical protein